MLMAVLIVDSCLLLAKFCPGAFCGHNRVDAPAPHMLLSTNRQHRSVYHDSLTTWETARCMGPDIFMMHRWRLRPLQAVTIHSSAENALIKTSGINAASSLSWCWLLKAEGVAGVHGLVCRPCEVWASGPLIHLLT